MMRNDRPLTIFLTWLSWLLLLFSIRQAREKAAAKDHNGDAFAHHVYVTSPGPTFDDAPAAAVQVNGVRRRPN